MRLKGLKLKFDVTDNPELSEAIQRRVFELGGEWCFSGDQVKHLPHMTMLHLEGGEMASNGKTYNYDHTLSTLDDLYHLPKTHTVSFDGNDPIEISHELLVAFQDQIK